MNKNTTIEVNNLWKEYRIGERQTARYSTLRDTIVDSALSPFKRARDLLSGQAQSAANLTERFWALQDINFSVQQGEVVGIIGHNGAGKSTLLKVLSRITEPTRGEVKFRGRLGSLLEVGTGFHPELTGRENIYLNGAILGMTRAEVTRKFDEIVDFAGVERFIETPVKHYSSGMYTRLAFAVAAHLEPEILLVDEVLSVGDATFQKKSMGKMGEVAESGRTVLFVSHNMAAVANFCTRVIVLQRGQAIFDGSQTEGIQNYMTSLNESGNSSDLSTRKDRYGDGVIRMTEIVFRDHQGNLTQNIGSGQDLDICISYEVKKPQELGNIIVGINCFNQTGTAVFTHSNRITKQDIYDLPPKGQFICRLRDIPLVPGSYSFDINVKNNEVYTDSIKNATQLSVIEGDFFGSGFLPPARMGICLVRGDWNLQAHK